MGTALRSLSWMGCVVGLGALVGCDGDSGDSAKDAADGRPDPTASEVTWYADVQPIVHEHCGSCHVSGGIAPLDLSTYGDAAALSQAIASAVESGTMPPWLAVETDECAPRLPWKGDMRLSEDDKATLRAWADGGALEGDPDDSPGLAEPPSLELDNPNAELEFEEPYKVEGTKDDFQCFVLDPGNTEEVWVTGAQILPGNPKVDHHALVFLDVYGETAEGDQQFPCFNTPSVPGFLMATWTPGAAPMRTPDSAGMPMAAGARLIVQMHYHPDPASTEFDQTVVQLEWTTEQPEWDAAQALVGNDSRYNDDDGTGLQPGDNDPESGAAFIIPAGERGHIETLLYTQSVPIEFPIFSPNCACTARAAPAPQT